MYGRILITLDGSTLAEAVLPFIARFSPYAGTEEVVLFSLVERGEAEELRSAEGYLRTRARELEDSWREQRAISPHIRCVVRGGMASQTASQILDFAEGNDIDLIAMASHGRSGIDRWIIGSVAEKVARGADIPILVVRSNQRPKALQFGLKSILAPLDGSKSAEQSLPFVGRLAAFGGGKVTILHVMSRPGRHRIEPYLKSRASGLAQSGVQVEVKFREGDIAAEIAREAEEEAVDLVVVSSHGSGHLARWAYGSVADKLLHGASAPLLLTRATRRTDVPDHLQGPLVHRCYNCARITHLETVTSEDRCSRCRQFLRSCGNCEQFDGAGCASQLPDAKELYPGNRCREFQFRKSRLVLR